MVIQDTPSLERLLVVDQQGPTRINVIFAPKLKVVGYSSVKYYNFQVQQSPYIPLLLDINVISSFEDVCSPVIQRSFT